MDENAYANACDDAEHRFEPIVRELVRQGIAEEDCLVWQTGGMIFVLAIVLKRDAKGRATRYLGVSDPDWRDCDGGFSFNWENHEAGAEFLERDPIWVDTKAKGDDLPAFVAEVVAWLNDSPCECCGCPRRACPNA